MKTSKGLRLNVSSSYALLPIYMNKYPQLELVNVIGQRRM